MLEPHYLIRGVGGSHAHGLAHENSDLDYRGVFSYPTEEFFTLREPKESIVTSAPQPDSASHELKKFLSLAAKGNPDVLEVLALDTYVDFDTVWGTKLLNLTPALLGTAQIRAAFMGYANQQFHALKSRTGAGNPSFSAGMGSRTWKHAKHMFRLLEAGERILRTGKLSAKVADRDWYLEVLPLLTAEEMIREFEARFAAVEKMPSVLPEKNPDYEAINKFLVAYRKAH